MSRNMPLTDDERHKLAAITRRTDVLQRLLIRHNDGWGRASTVLRYPLLVAALCQRGLRGDLVRLPINACRRAYEEEPVHLHGNEGIEHARLKLAALNWMRIEGASDAQPEMRQQGWIADAFSDDFHWAIECGNTDASRLLDVLTWARAPRFTVIPFQRTHWRDGSQRRLIGVDFYWPPSLSRWVLQRELEDMRACADVLSFGRG